jgi:Zn finger protein HypA/HybF involved in hydrogenase expression
MENVKLESKKKFTKPLLKCKQCGSLVPPEDLANGYYCKKCHQIND